MSILFWILIAYLGLGLAIAHSFRRKLGLPWSRVPWVVLSSPAIAVWRVLELIWMTIILAISSWGKPS